MLDRAAVRALHEQGAGVREIARVLGASRNAVRRALDPAAAMAYRRRSRLVDVEAHVRAVLEEFPFMPAARVAEHVGWTGSVRHLSSLVATLRDELAPRHPPGATASTGSVSAGVCAAARIPATRLRLGRSTWP